MTKNKESAHQISTGQQISAQKPTIDAFQVLNVNQKATLMKHLYVFQIILITVLLLLLEGCLGRFQVLVK